MKVLLAALLLGVASVVVPLMLAVASADQSIPPPTTKVAPVIAKQKDRAHPSEADAAQDGTMCTSDTYFREHRVEFQNLDLEAKSMALSPEKRLVESAAWALASEQESGAEQFTAMDIGANEGKFTELILDELPHARVDMFEVLPNLAQALRLRFAGRGNVRVEQRAMGNQSAGDISIKGDPAWIKPGRESTGASVFRRSAKYEEVIAIVPASSIDSVLNSDRKFIHFLKIDTEGNDARVLQGARRALEDKRVRVVFFENNIMQREIGFTLWRTTQMLNGYGYHAYLFGNRKLLPLYKLCESNEAFASSKTMNVVALPAGYEIEHALVERYASAYSVNSKKERLAKADAASV